MGSFVGILTGILLLSLMMLLHELGHYISGRILGFKIIEFSIFMGPVLLSWTSKKTGIKYSLKLLPIGASVRFVGEEDMGEEPSDHPDSFNAKKPWKRAIVLSMGSLVNIVTGILAFAILFTSVGFDTKTIDSIEDGSPAQVAGLQEGDELLSVNKSKIFTPMDFAMEREFSGHSKDMEIVYIEGESGSKKHLTLEAVEGKKTFLGISYDADPKHKGWLIVDITSNPDKREDMLMKGDIILVINGISTLTNPKVALRQVTESRERDIDIKVFRAGQEVFIRQRGTEESYFLDPGIGFKTEKSFMGSIKHSFAYSASMTKLTFKGLARIFTGKIAAKDSLSGPVGIVSIVGSVVKEDADLRYKLVNLLHLFALISLNLGIFNLFPIPALDGSHLLLLLVEKIRGKRLSNKTQGLIVGIGFAMIIALALMGLTFDIMRLMGK